MSIEDRVRELNGGTYTKKSYAVVFFNETVTTESYTLSPPDALPIPRPSQ